MKTHFLNIYHLGIKELRSLAADKVLLLLIIWAFTGGVYSASKGVSQELRNAPVAIVDQDQSQISHRFVYALTQPYFKKPDVLGLYEVDRALDRGYYSFTIIIPPSFEKDLHARRNPTIQINIDATVMSQAFIGAGYIQSIFTTEINEFLNRSYETTASPINLVTRVKFNPNLTGFWFGGVMETINNINMLTIILVGAAYIREREHGTIEHLLAMPLVPIEIMASKIWANGLAVLIAATFALTVMIKTVLKVPIAGSIPLFISVAAVYLFSAGSIGIFLGTIARSMPQLGLLIFLTIIPMQM
ncbi:MAG: ABC transporter permease, partial [Oxalobacter sp.]|nr:ABC transporter permease [Oxalobacter sp.]